MPRKCWTWRPLLYIRLPSCCPNLAGLNRSSRTGYQGLWERFYTGKTHALRPPISNSTATLLTRNSVDETTVLLLQSLHTLVSTTEGAKVFTTIGDLSPPHRNCPFTYHCVGHTLFCLAKCHGIRRREALVDRPNCRHHAKLGIFLRRHRWSDFA